jgi:hypothetical protein
VIDDLFELGVGQAIRAGDVEVNTQLVRRPKRNEDAKGHQASRATIEAFAAPQATEHVGEREVTQLRAKRRRSGCVRLAHRIGELRKDLLEHPQSDLAVTFRH